MHKTSTYMGTYLYHRWWVNFPWGGSIFYNGKVTRGSVFYGGQYSIWLRRYFLRPHKHQANVISQWSRLDSARLCSPCGEVGTRSVSTVSPAPLISCHSEPPLSLTECWLGWEPECVASKVCQLCDCADWLTHARYASLQPEYSCCYRVRYGCLAVKSIWDWSRI